MLSESHRKVGLYRPVAELQRKEHSTQSVTARQAKRASNYSLMGGKGNNKDRQMCGRRKRYIQEKTWTWAQGQGHEGPICGIREIGGASICTIQRDVATQMSGTSMAAEVSKKRYLSA